MTAGIEEYLKDVSMQVVKHKMNALGKKGKRQIGPLTEEYVHCCQEEHKIILEEDGVEEGLAESIVNSWESSDQQENILIRKSMGDVFEINEFCVSARITCDELCEVFPEVNEETKDYQCTLYMDQSQNIVLELKNEMTWFCRDKPERTLAYLDNGVAERLGKKFFMTHEGTIVSQEDYQYLK